MEDFNADNAKIDAAVKAVDTRIDGLAAGKADKTALAALQTVTAGKADASALEAVKAEIIAGTCTGNGTAEREIVLGRKPKAVLIVSPNGQMHHDTFVYGGLALQNFPVTQDNVPGLTLTDTGFIVARSVGAASCQRRKRAHIRSRS